MAMVGMLLMAVGGIVSFVFAVIILIKAFQTSLLWGLASLFIPFVILVFVIKNWDDTFVIKNWDDTKKPFLYAVGGWVLTIVGVAIGGAASAAM